MMMNGRPDVRRIKAIARSFGVTSDLGRIAGDAVKEAAAQTRVLRYIASNPDVEKAVARAGVSAAYYEQAIDRARKTALKFSADVEAKAKAAKKAYDRTVRTMAGEGVLDGRGDDSERGRFGWGWAEVRWITGKRQVVYGGNLG